MGLARSKARDFENGASCGLYPGRAIFVFVMRFTHMAVSRLKGF
jgi:hypothetical protein